MAFLSIGFGLDGMVQTKNVIGLNKGCLIIDG